MFFESLTSSTTNNVAATVESEIVESDNEDESVKKPLLSTLSSEENKKGKTLKLNSFILNEKHYIDSEIKLFGLFLISFDIKLGNTIEWKKIINDDINLSPIEFKAMPSGIHSMQHDFIYFREGKLYGLAVFQCLKLNNQQERNIRMKSIAILSNSFKYLHNFIDFLLYQVKIQLENPGNYEALTEFWNTYNNPLESQIMIMDPNLEILDSYHNQLKTVFIIFSAILVQIYSNMEYALLNKRILFYNIPPISLNCLNIYCCFILKNTTLKKIIDKQFLKAYFYINLHDIDLIINESYYVAYTSEKIFETKTYLYDLYINKKRIMYPNQFDTKNSACVTNNKIIRLTNVDEKRYKFLKNFKSFFFTELNDRLFGTLLEIENFNQQVTPEHMKMMNLDQNDDRDFLLQIIRFYDINVKLVPKESFCRKD